MMRKFILAYIVLTLLLILVCSGCSSMNIIATDSRCVPRQYCPYTDPPPAIRREAIRSSGSYQGDPAVR